MCGLYLVLVTGPFGKQPFQRLQNLCQFYCASGPCRPCRSETSTSSRSCDPSAALVRRIGLLTSRGCAQHIVDRCAMRCPTAPRAPTTPPTSIMQLTNFFPTTRTVADTTACTFQVLKHLANFFSCWLYYYSISILFRGSENTTTINLDRHSNNCAFNFQLIIRCHFSGNVEKTKNVSPEGYAKRYFY